MATQTQKNLQALRQLVSKMPAVGKKAVIDKIDSVLPKSMGPGQASTTAAADAAVAAGVDAMLGNDKKQLQKDQKKVEKVLGPDSIYADVQKKLTGDDGDVRKKQAVNIISEMNPTYEKAKNKTARDKAGYKVDLSTATQPAKGKKELNYEGKKDFVGVQKQEMRDLRKEENKENKKNRGLEHFMRGINDASNFMARTTATMGNFLDPNQKLGDRQGLMDTANWLTNADEGYSDAYLLGRLAAALGQIVGTFGLGKGMQTDPSLGQYFNMLGLGALNETMFNDLAYGGELTPEKKAQIDAEVEAGLNNLIEKLQEYFNKRSGNKKDDDLYI